jgi:hypothetical protein
VKEEDLAPPNLFHNAFSVFEETGLLKGETQSMKRVALFTPFAVLAAISIVAGCGSNNNASTTYEVSSSSCSNITSQADGQPAVVSNRGYNVDAGAELVVLSNSGIEVVVRDAALLGENSESHVHNDFIITLNSDRYTYSTTDIITIWATLEYTGENDSVEIWHPLPLMLFKITGGNDIEVGDVLVGAINDVELSSVLERGNVYHFEYRKSGGWSATDPNAGFWEEFFGREYLQLPPGTYTITALGLFKISDYFGIESELSVDITIEVTEYVC